MKAIDINKLKEEANRCFLCKVPKCKKYCPIDTQIPAVIQLFKENKIDEQGRYYLITTLQQSVEWFAHMKISVRKLYKRNKR